VEGPVEVAQGQADGADAVGGALGAGLAEAHDRDLVPLGGEPLRQDLYGALATPHHPRQVVGVRQQEPQPLAPASTTAADRPTVSSSTSLAMPCRARSSCSPRCSACTASARESATTSPTSSARRAPEDASAKPSPRTPADRSSEWVVVVREIRASGARPSAKIMACSLIATAHLARETRSWASKASRGVTTCAHRETSGALASQRRNTASSSPGRVSIATSSTLSTPCRSTRRLTALVSSGSSGPNTMPSLASDTTAYAPCGEGRLAAATAAGWWRSR